MPAVWFATHWGLNSKGQCGIHGISTNSHPAITVRVNPATVPTTKTSILNKFPLKGGRPIMSG